MIEAPGLTAWAALAAIGCFSGLTVGLLGIGGGLIVVPALDFWAPLHRHRQARSAEDRHCNLTRGPAHRYGHDPDAQNPAASHTAANSYQIHRGGPCRASLPAKAANSVPPCAANRITAAGRKLSYTVRRTV